MTPRYRVRCWKSGPLPVPPAAGATAAAWQAFYRAPRPRVLVGTVVIEAEASDDATQAAAQVHPSADSLETEALG